jgi:hypothetical protein
MAAANLAPNSASEIADEGAARLAAGGRLLLYTGSPIVDGVDLFHETLRARLEARP